MIACITTSLKIKKKQFKIRLFVLKLIVFNGIDLKKHLLMLTENNILLIDLLATLLNINDNTIDAIVVLNFKHSNVNIYNWMIK